jgi:hypothetical protein
VGTGEFVVIGIESIGGERFFNPNIAHGLLGLMQVTAHIQKTGAKK